MARRKLSRPLPPTFYYHYSNPESQGALVYETKGFPDSYDRETEEIHEAYSDRLQQWDAENFKRLSMLLYGQDDFGDQGWSYDLPKLGDDGLREFARVAFKQEHKPKHVRVIHYFNVSNGFNCPVIAAIFDKVETHAG